MIQQKAPFLKPASQKLDGIGGLKSSRQDPNSWLATQLVHFQGQEAHYLMRHPTPSLAITDSWEVLSSTEFQTVSPTASNFSYFYSSSIH